MNNNCIIVNYQPFSISSDIVIINNNDRHFHYLSSDPYKITDELIDLAYATEIYNIKMNAPLELANTIIELIKKQEKKNFTFNQINVEVI